MYKQQKQPKSERVGCRVPAQIRARLEAEMARTFSSEGSLVCQALDAFLPALECYKRNNAMRGSAK